MKKILDLIEMIALSMVVSVSGNVPKNSVEKNETNDIPKNQEQLVENSDITDITLSFVGDCTLGSDDNFGYDRSFNQVADNNDYSYFFKNVQSVLAEDDLTIANLETTFTNATKKKDKQFNFKGDPTYVNILLDGSVEIVNLANNHSHDYLEKGFNDTVQTLKESNVAYYGYNTFLIKEIDGIKVGLAGFTGFSSDKATKIQIKEALNYFDENDVDIKVVTFHWGIEKDNYYNKTQDALGKYAIDNGANLVVGHHPHVLQGIKEYKDAYIVYSLGNFVFGGNKNPSDKDSMIFQETFTFKDDKLIKTDTKIIPVSISSKSNTNDYQPYVLSGDAKQRVLERINKYSYK